MEVYTMEGKLITTKGLTAYTQQLKTWLGDTYQTKADMALYTKTADLSKYLDKRYVIQGSALYGNPIYKHTVTVVSTPGFILHLTIFTTSAAKYQTAREFSAVWEASWTLRSGFGEGANSSGVFNGIVVGVISISATTVRISGIQASSTVSNWDQVYTLNTWIYSDQQPNPARI